MKRIFLGLLLIFSLGYSQFAKVGTAGAKFLSIGASSRAMGMGEAYVAVANDASSVFWNPAGLANLSGQQVYIGYTNWLVDTRVPALAYIRPLDAYSRIGIFLGGAYSGGFKETTLGLSGVTVTGKEFAYTGLEAGITYARYFTDKFAAGLNVKTVYENFGGYTNAIGVAMDAGTYFHTGWKSLRVAMSLQHLGTELKPKGTYDLYILKGTDLVTEEREFRSYYLPMIFRLGAAMELIDNPLQRLTISFEATHPNDNLETYALGAEYTLINMLSLRTGYCANKDEGGFSFGVGFKTSKICLDYSFSDFGELPDIHRLGISLGF